MIVGPEKTKFFINKEVICKDSDFFRTACKDEWSERRNNNVRLAEDDSTIFGIYLSWLTTRDINDAEGLISLSSSAEPANNEHGDISRKREESMLDRFHQLLCCYALGDSLQSIKFPNAVIDELVGLSEIFNEGRHGLLASGTAAIRMIYENSVPNSVLRKYCIDHFLPGIAREDIEPCIKQYLVEDFEEFLADLLPRLLTPQANIDYPLEFPWEAPWNRDRCFYHRHPDEEEGYKCPVVVP